MEMLQHLGAGFEAAFTLTNMMFICGGVILGIIFGVTPGVGSVTALAIRGNCLPGWHQQGRYVGGRHTGDPDQHAWNAGGGGNGARRVSPH
jgi:hypothetical protein